jgi:hypothetical protein
MLIFSYGSNMCLARLKNRVPSATFVSIGTLLEHKIKLHKLSKDGSGRRTRFILALALTLFGELSLI